MGVDVAPAGGGTAPPDVSRIAGLPILKGLLLYGATATFVAIHLYFVIEIWGATRRSAALQRRAPQGRRRTGRRARVGLRTVRRSTDASAGRQPAPRAGRDHEQPEGQEPLRSSASISIRKFLSLEPPNKDSASWPLTGGIWAYACVAGAVAVTYAMNANETPADLRTIAVAFGGYVIALVTAAFAAGGRVTA